LLLPSLLSLLGSQQLIDVRPTAFPESAPAGTRRLLHETYMSDAVNDEGSVGGPIPMSAYPFFSTNLALEASTYELLIVRRDDAINLREWCVVKRGIERRLRVAMDFSDSRARRFEGLK